MKRLGPYSRAFVKVLRKVRSAHLCLDREEMAERTRRLAAAARPDPEAEFGRNYVTAFDPCDRCKRRDCIHCEMVLRQPSTPRQTRKELHS